jgi:hypothetical protein
MTLVTEDKKEPETPFDIKLGLVKIMQDTSLLLIHQMYWRDIEMIRNVSSIVCFMYKNVFFFFCFCIYCNFLV